MSAATSPPVDTAAAASACQQPAGKPRTGACVSSTQRRTRPTTVAELSLDLGAVSPVGVSELSGSE
ncbi:Hypothetical protein SMAX5B_004072 [Scophthalmus maximus]|uniref:Uncharacterized protein n=1 Tax=Scophthalmus maximus TaxID=52904 RepID=A0A2U9B7W2_SCOMX|nr:Hypothetical protein SMAX5B_004072 [Scophthalmus maximus]